KRNLIADFWQNVPASVRLAEHVQIVVLVPMDLPARAHASCLHAGSPVENDHDVFAEGFVVAFESDSEPFCRGNHQSDGNDSPGNAEHRQKCAQLVRSQGVYRISQQVREVHVAIAAVVVISSEHSDTSFFPRTQPPWNAERSIPLLGLLISMQPSGISR